MQMKDTEGFHKIETKFAAYLCMNSLIPAELQIVTGCIGAINLVIISLVNDIYYS